MSTESWPRKISQSKQIPPRRIKYQILSSPSAILSIRVAVAFTCVRTPDWICSGWAAGAWGTMGTALSILTGNPECFVVACRPAGENSATVTPLCWVCGIVHLGVFVGLFLAFLFKESVTQVGSRHLRQRTFTEVLEVRRRGTGLAPFRLN